MSSEDTYKTIKEPGFGEFKDRGSKFLAFAYPVQTEKEIKELLGELKKKHHSARHHCYAFRIGAEEFYYRTNDDGEPSGTAGKPIYGQILSFDLTNILIVVVRYFGGTLLGTSGLINAYRSAAKVCLEHATVVDQVINENITIKFQYASMNSVMRIIKEESAEILSQDFSDTCTISLGIPKSKAEKCMAKFHVLSDVQVVPG
ncbi:MAG: YigZ family protein [Bacteroidales bacterium]|nr:YigZ family protein [Bacteroidales bacterium]